jgi:hypothetical protein
MGGAQTLNIAFAHLDWFSSIGVFSSGILGGNVADWEKNHMAALDDPGLNCQQSKPRDAEQARFCRHVPGERWRSHVGQLAKLPV